MLTVFGSTALDTIRTPKKTLKNALGGAATYAAISASFFTKPSLKIVSKYTKPGRKRIFKHFNTF